ncbi:MULTISPECIES: fimbrial protein [Serratia]|jgi:type 1 fimbria pilin|uniref:fimbrial protein n=1 Tax=Serratia TaxID=613 RepID=UPI0008092163|nr:MULTISPECIES: fimbrial protein [Serratia]ANS41621.1 PAP fimbrial minor pilin protein [Serratia inhibens PRI-2C]CAI2513916.1 PAP fimbrial minor pilin protein precursor [Serratia proteamaculans]
MLPKVQRVVVSSLLFMVSGSQAWSATPAGWGRVNMQGSIIETACAIDTQSRDQTIDMDTAPVSQIARDGQGVSRPFSIRLVNCVLGRIDPRLPDWQRFQITFDGRADTGGFGVEGDAKGIALQISDTFGNIANPGKPLPSGEISPGDKILNYSIRLVGNDQQLKAGEYNSTLRFKMEYY